LVALWDERHADLAQAGSGHHVVVVDATSLYRRAHDVSFHSETLFGASLHRTRSTERERERDGSRAYGAERSEHPAWSVVEALDHRAKRDGVHHHQSLLPVARCQRFRQRSGMVVKGLSTRVAAHAVVLLP
jgi:hypothetical protein